MRILMALVFVALSSAHSPLSLASNSALKLLQQPNHFAIIRHALAPGTGDPAEFDLGDCSTQRNLNADGRAQAEEIGERLRNVGISSAAVYSSAWCRCLDTARLFKLGDVTALPELNSFFQDMARGPGQLRDLREWLAEQPLQQPTLLVTHQVVITGLLDVFPRSGEIVIVKRTASNTLEVVSRVYTISEISTG